MRLGDRRSFAALRMTSTYCGHQHIADINILRVNLHHERGRPRRTYPVGPAFFVIGITDYLFLSASQYQD